MHDPTKTSYLAKPKPSPSMYYATGYTNRFGGFHRTTDTYAYVGLIGLLLRYIYKPKLARWILREIWRRWHHRMCDTTDFHHDFGCLRDPWVRTEDAEYRWRRVWRGHADV